MWSQSTLEVQKWLCEYLQALYDILLVTPSPYVDDKLLFSRALGTALANKCPRCATMPEELPEFMTKRCWPKIETEINEVCTPSAFSHWIDPHVYQVEFKLEF